MENHQEIFKYSHMVYPPSSLVYCMHQWGFHPLVYFPNIDSPVYYSGGRKSVIINKNNVVNEHESLIAFFFDPFEPLYRVSVSDNLNSTKFHLIGIYC